MNTPQEIDETLAELDQALAFFTKECRLARQEENLPRVQDLSNHILRLSKEKLALAEKHGRLITLHQAKDAIAAADDYHVKALWELAPEKAADVVELAAEYREQAKIFEVA